MSNWIYRPHHGRYEVGFYNPGSNDWWTEDTFDAAEDAADRVCHLNGKYPLQTVRLLGALKAIRARINGEWDDPQLLRFGALSVNTDTDVLRIIEEVLR